MTIMADAKRRSHQEAVLFDGPTSYTWLRVKTGPSSCRCQMRFFLNGKARGPLRPVFQQTATLAFSTAAQAADDEAEAAEPGDGGSQGAAGGQKRGRRFRQTRRRGHIFQAQAISDSLED